MQCRSLRTTIWVFAAMTRCLWTESVRPSQDSAAVGKTRQYIRENLPYQQTGVSSFFVKVEDPAVGNLSRNSDYPFSQSFQYFHIKTNVLLRPGFANSFTALLAVMLFSHRTLYSVHIMKVETLILTFLNRITRNHASSVRITKHFKRLNLAQRMSGNAD